MVTSGTAGPGGRLTVFQGTALYVGVVLGTGIVALPALAAQVAGPASLLAWVALVVLSAPLAATFAALGSRHPDAAVLLVLSGPYLLCPVAVAAAALGYGRRASTALRAAPRP